MKHELQFFFRFFREIKTGHDGMIEKYIKSVLKIIPAHLKK